MVCLYDISEITRIKCHGSQPRSIREQNFLINHKLIKGVCFKRNCGAALVGKYDKIIWFYQLS